MLVAIVDSVRLSKVSGVVPVVQEPDHAVVPFAHAKADIVVEFSKL